MAQQAGPLEAGPSQVDYETVFTNKKVDRHKQPLATWSCAKLCVPWPPVSPRLQAGMEEVDAEHVKRVVYEASKVSRLGLTRSFFGWAAAVDRSAA
jgi:hypothetical protein